MIPSPLWRWAVAAPIGALYLYGAAGLIGGAIPRNGAWQPPERGVRVYVEDNGIHTGIIVPAAGWEDLIRPADFGDPRYARHGWRSIGWGDRDFYIGTPTWWDLNPVVVLKGAVGSGGSVMHVDAVPEPVAGPGVRAITLRPDEYARLTVFIRASFAPGPPIKGYGSWDAFYPATGRYSALRTCNAWTGEALTAARVKMGAWTPFSATVMWWLP
ncbi:conserved hypothetical protein [Sphingomonas guangdongensis]|uniref:TIGR02117 family protein n=1 Tax=Sphingomonas guangdongensis TaxID=1141890 RepID=A0A285Q9Q1_9SPHN|nr:TIGR02117 family protein [Sphingomonas guangdongensis]SOB78665.1 conserved hypothetical protein [Sphingomonas guangdongensis]